jgi:histone acetyltransferase 1
MDKSRLINLDSFAPVATYQEAVQNDENMKDFKPPGQRIKTYKTKGKEFGIWMGTLADPEIRLLLDRMQIFISFFIEGGTPINLDDQEWTLERWSVFFLCVPSAPLPNSFTHKSQLRSPL